MRKTIALAFLIAAAVATPAMAQKAPPVDEAARDPALVKARATVIAAVKRRDLKALNAHLHPQIKLDFGGGAGRARLARNLQRNPALWDELLWCLENGGKFSEKTFAAPYTFVVDHGEIDPFEAGVVVAENVPARAEPKADAAVVATYSHEVVTVKNWWPQSPPSEAPKPFFAQRKDWVEIETKDKKKAYMEGRFVRSVVDYRAVFERYAGAWKISAFVAGD
jgi:hypothetical protein